MELALIEPSHRCQKCKTPLECDGYRERTKMELDEFCERKRRKEISELPKWLRWTYSPDVFGEGELRTKLWYDKSVEYWHCPNCHEEYSTIKKQ
jgi:hypothetical protein